MLKKIITYMLVTALLLSSAFMFPVTAAETQAAAKDSLSKLKMMGVVNESEITMSGNITRELFSKIIVNATGNYELAQSLSGSASFSDVQKTSEYCGYIHAAVNKGYLSAFANGQFKPKEPMNFASLCTAMVKALGYSNSDIIGTWPAGYIEKAKSLGLTNGFTLKSTDKVSASAALIMVNRMLNTNIKKTNSAEADTTLIESAGLLDDQDNWVYGEPQIAINYNPSSKKVGDIKFQEGIPVLRNTVDNTVSPANNVIGETITVNDIKEKDVVYEVYNKLNVLMYYLVIDNKVEGEITSVLPSKYSPTAIKINDASYSLGEYVDVDKFNAAKGSFNVGEDITAVLGYDGKVVDAYLAENEDSADYAFVVNTSSAVSKEAADYGKVYYTVDLMLTDGTTKTYKTAEDPLNYKWRLVKFSYINSQTVALLNLTYISSTDVVIDKYEKKAGQSYTTDNIKIYNYTDTSVDLISWNDVPNGTLAAGKVKFIGTTGVFEDINLLLVYDIFDDQYKDFVVQKIQEPNGKTITEYIYTLAAGGNQYTYNSKNEIAGATVGSVFRMKMYNNSISSFSQLKNPDGTGCYIQAVDSKRIKMNNWVYLFGSDAAIYIKDYSGSLVKKNIADIVTGENSQYNSIKIYCNRSLNNGGKVEAVIIGYN